MSDLQEDSRVPVVEVDQLQVGDGVDHSHGTAGHGHSDRQQHHIATQGYGGKHQRDGKGGGEEGGQ